MKKGSILSRLYLFLIILAVLMAIPITAYAVPEDENYDDNVVGYSNLSTEQIIDELKYTLTGSNIVIDIANDSTWSSLGDDDKDYFIGIDAATVKIEAESGSGFKLNGFTMDAYATGDVTITPSSASAITRTCNELNQIFSNVTTTGATLNGSVNANNATTTVTFEYGLSEAYGTTVTASQSPVTGSSGKSVSSSITGLTPNTTYH